MSSSFVSGNQKLGGPGFDDKKDDDWEKLSRISRRTGQNIKPVNLDSFEDKFKALNNMHLDIGKHKSNSKPC